MATLSPQQLSDTGLKERFFRYFQHEVTGEHASIFAASSLQPRLTMCVMQLYRNKSKDLRTKQPPVASVPTG